MTNYTCHKTTFAPAALLRDQGGTRFFLPVMTRDVGIAAVAVMFTIAIDAANNNP